ncbi:MAG: cytochrome c oxidase subunit 3 family protein [Candidatus Marinimicrobia bacterium]|nr:cytochrome c oxidase subunit 3 family protein [Candidatus Neomarinimicrobiota bacterium]MCF7829783.1 cytochrome c oxidase subunit 3 family protein [Candidatus Neomarinimicrobiota bacterium]MCF7881784.1 cytochrome c oxidase subunit 3 family protein [Candidatus Neomarinimicrobiota bacterium]
MSHGGDRPAFLQHHFSDAEQQRESAKLGMWIFLLTEILLFGGLFGFYVFFRAWNPEMFINAHEHLNRVLGGINTVVLIVSSLTIALAIRSIQLNEKKKTMWFLATTILLAVVFLVIKYFEYEHKFHLGQLPGQFYTYTGIEGTNPHIFFSVYFAMTGLHGLHVIFGILAIGWVLWRTKKGEFSAEYHTPVEMVGLYWHLVDIIWIFLFPLLYLIG